MGVRFLLVDAVSAEERGGKKDWKKNLRTPRLCQRAELSAVTLPLFMMAKEGRTVAID
jgi:hypothetical protein